MPGIIKSKTVDERLTVRLTAQQQKFKAEHPQINFSEVLRIQLDKFIKTFDEEEYRKVTGN